MSDPSPSDTPAQTPSAQRSGGDAAAFVLELARALHVYGLPSHRLENALNHMATTLGLNAEFLVTPTGITCSIEDETRLMRINQGETHLERLADLDRIMTEVIAGTLDPATATERMRGFATAASRHGPVATVLAFAVASGTAALFFGGAWRESVGAASIGCAIGILAVVSSGHVRVARLLPTLAGFLAAAGAHGLATVFEPMFAFIPTLAGLIILIPGLTLTIAMSELAHYHLVSGTARLMGASITFLQLGFGAAVGWRAGPFLFGEVALTTPPEPLAAWVQWVVLPVTTAAFVVLFRAHPRHYGQILVGAAAAYGVSRTSSAAFGPEVGMALGAWALGCTSTLLARLSSSPAAISLLPGLLLLVPGSLGLESLKSLVSGDVPLGVESAFRMTLFAMSLVTGLFLSNLTLRPRAL